MKEHSFFLRTGLLAPTKEALIVTADWDTMLHTIDGFLAAAKRLRKRSK